MRLRCDIVLPIVDQSRVTTLAVETTGPLANQDFCQCSCGDRRCRRSRRRRHRR